LSILRERIYSRFCEQPEREAMSDFFFVGSIVFFVISAFTCVFARSWENKNGNNHRWDHRVAAVCPLFAAWIRPEKF
jgi:hypothetical protein